MPATQKEMEADAIEALRDAIEQSGLRSHVDRPVSSDNGVDLILDGPHGRITIQVKAASAPVPSRIEAMIRAAEAIPPTGRAGLMVLVADEIPQDSRRLLREKGWGYLDRRGRLWLQTPDLIVNDTDLKPLPRLRSDGSKSDPLGGRAGQGIALGMLMHPHEALGVRGLARLAQCSASMAHKVIKQLQGVALVRSDTTPLVPELFWALADVWAPERHHVSRAPNPEDLRQLPAEARDIEQWVLSNDVAAASWGAPVVVRLGQREDFYIAGSALARAVRLLQPVTQEVAGASLSAAPSPAVLQESFDATSKVKPLRLWRLAHPVVVALDLAQDHSRGREIIDAWSPPPEFNRVW